MLWSNSPLKMGQASTGRMHGPPQGGMRSSRHSDCSSNTTLDDFTRTPSRTGTLSSVESLKIGTIQIHNENGVDPANNSKPSSPSSGSIFTPDSTVKSSTPTTSSGNLSSRASTSSSPIPTVTNNNHKEGAVYKDGPVHKDRPVYKDDPGHYVVQHKDSTEHGDHAVVKDGAATSRPLQRTHKLHHHHHPSSKHSRFVQLPDAVIARVFSFLPTKSLCRCSAVCRRWHRLAYQPRLWAAIDLSGRHTDVDRGLQVLTHRLSQETPYVCLTVQRVTLNGCGRLTDLGLMALATKCPELTHLELKGCSRITNEAIFKVVSQCSSLDHLDVSGCKQLNCMNLPADDTMNPERSTFLRQKINLRFLDMSDCPLLDDEGLRTIATNCPALVNVYLRKCDLISDIGVQYLAAHCMMLREVSMSDCPRVTDLGLREFSKLENHLRYLSIAKCEFVTDIGVNLLAKRCSKLRYLNARGCVYLTDKSLEALSRGCTKLRSLDVGKCPSVTDRGLGLVVEHCPSLRKLSLKGCLYITDRTIRLLAAKCPELQQLNIQDCEQVTREGYRLLKKCCKKCIIEHTNPSFY